MHLREYLASQKVCARVDEITFPGANRFYTFLFCAMREADTNNTDLLKEAFPNIYNELQKRYNAPGGALTDVEMEFVQSLYERPEEDDGEETVFAIVDL